VVNPGSRVVTPGRHHPAVSNPSKKPAALVCGSRVLRRNQLLLDGNVKLGTVLTIFTMGVAQCCFRSPASCGIVRVGRWRSVNAVTFRRAQWGLDRARAERAATDTTEGFRFSYPYEYEGRWGSLPR
jgi:hypothetical protein